MYKIVGVKVSTAEINGKSYMGYWVYYTDDYKREGLDGVTCGSAYLRKRVYESCHYVPSVGDDVKMKLERGKNGTQFVQWMYPNK